VTERGSRLQSSVVTFGPAGRLACTVVIVGAPACFLLYGGLFGVVGAVVWTGWVLPRAMKDTWRRAALPSTELTRLRDQTAREGAARQIPPVAHPAFDPYAPRPTRW
jgi:hypothetical protein